MEQGPEFLRVVGKFTQKGHSLGSVIGLDMLRRLYTDYALLAGEHPSVHNLEKIKAFITPGSPLEKTLLFLSKDDYKSRFLEWNNAIDASLFNDARGPQWFNFWIASDIVCDPLASYPVAPHHERELPLGEHINPWSHSDYWHDSLFVRKVLQIVTFQKTDELNTLSLFPY